VAIAGGQVRPVVGQLVEVLLFVVGHQQGHPAPVGVPTLVRRGVVGLLGGVLDAGGQAAVGVVVVVQGDAHLFEVVGALGAVGGVADLLHGRQEQRDQDADDGDHHQQLDQGKT